MGDDTNTVGRIDLARAKAHLGVDLPDDDALIESLIAAAYRAVEGKLFRRVYAAAEDALLDPTGIVVQADLNAAVLLLVGHLYQNREANAERALVELPMGVTWLLEPYINYAGGA